MSGAMKVAGGCGSHPSLLKMQAKMVSVIKLYSIYTPHLSLSLSISLVLSPYQVQVVTVALASLTSSQDLKWLK